MDRTLMAWLEKVVLREADSTSKMYMAPDSVERAMR